MMRGFNSYTRRSTHLVPGQGSISQTILDFGPSADADERTLSLGIIEDGIRARFRNAHEEFWQIYWQ